MSKHTPGPWSSRNGRVFQTDWESLTIANVGRAFDGDYSEANARLIAAAPELLEALQSLVAVADFYAPFSAQEQIAKASAAIVKATGGQQ